MVRTIGTASFPITSVQLPAQTFSLGTKETFYRRRILIQVSQAVTRHWGNVISSSIRGISRRQSTSLLRLRWQRILLIALLINISQDRMQIAISFLLFSRKLQGTRVAIFRALHWLTTNTLVYTRVSFRRNSPKRKTCGRRCPDTCGTSRSFSRTTVPSTSSATRQEKHVQISTQGTEGNEYS